MTSAKKLTSPAYSLGHCFLASLAGAVANGLAFVIRSNGSWGGGIFLFVVSFAVGFVILATAGRPMARSLAREGKDTLITGLVLGAAMGSLAGAILTGFVILAVFGSPAVAFSIVSSLFGLIGGVISGAVAGLVFIGLGRTESRRSEPTVVPPKARLWIWPVVALGLGMPVAAIVSITTHEKPEPKTFPIAGTIYHWPVGTMVFPPERPGHYGKGNVSYRSSDRYPDPDSFMIIYDGNGQKELNEAGLPHLRMITSRFDKLGDFSFRTTSAGLVVCNRRNAQVGMAYPCGLSFVHRGARWELHFGAHRAGDAEELQKEAVSRLESFRQRARN